MNKRSGRLRIVFNAPAVLGFALACVAAQVLNLVTGGAANRLLFSVYRTSPANPLAWLRCATHVLGHADWEHLLNNLLLLLILGPMLEEKYGTRDMLLVMLVTAVVTGAINLLFFPRVALMGASGIVFAMVLLSSITGAAQGEIPLTFIVVAALYLGQQVYQGIFLNDEVSQLTHIAGGLVGSAMGFYLMRKQK